MTKQVSICTFNCENLFARYKFREAPAGGKASKSAPKLAAHWGYLPPMGFKTSFQLFGDDRWRRLTALALLGGEGLPGPDIACLQEIENMMALRKFNDEYLEHRYAHTLLIDGHDPRDIDVAVLSKHPITDIRSHMDDTEAGGGGFVFSRDCLEVTFDVEGTPLTLLVNHLKSQYSQSADETRRADERRKVQAQAVAGIVTRRFQPQGWKTSDVCVVGDFNDTPDSPALAPLLGMGWVNVVDRLPPAERWTHLWTAKNVVGQLDYLLLSPSLAARAPGAPHVERRGLITKRNMRVYFEGEADGSRGVEAALPADRFPGVTGTISASDHCSVTMTLNLA